jgi:replicative DNA helicase
VKQPALTVALTVQPSVLQGLQRHQEFRERGLLGRFLYAVPPVLLGHRQTRTTPVAPVICATYHARLTALLALPLEMDEDGFPVARALQMTPEASALFEDFESQVEPMLGPFGFLGHMTNWGGKLVGNVARIIGLLHCASTPQAPWLTRIAPHTVRCALRIGEYLVAHARAAYGVMGADSGVEDAKHILTWLKRDARQAISKRDLHQGTKTRFPRVGMMEPALLLLVEHGFLALQAPSTQDGKLGRPAGPSYEVNPHLYIHNHGAQNPQNPQKGDAGGGFEGFEDFEIQETALNGTHNSAMDYGTKSVGDVDEVVISPP